MEQIIDKTTPKKTIVKLSARELEAIVERFPWYSIARREEFIRLSRDRRHISDRRLRLAAIHLPSRDELYRIAHSYYIGDENQLIQLDGKVELVDENKFDIDDLANGISFDNEFPNTGIMEIEPIAEIEPVKAIDPIAEIEPIKEIAPIKINPIPEKRELHIIGGDYFDKVDFDQFENDDSWYKDTKTFSSQLTFDLNEYNSFTDESFYTETLAKVYIEQELYNEALEVYSKLILLYPEKSSYFADFVRDLKSKNN